MDTQSLREMAINTPRKQEPIPTPFWPGTDGHVNVLDVPTDEIAELRKIWIEERKDPVGFSASLICRALVNKHNGEQVFPDTDRDVIRAMGSSVINPIASQLTKFLGLETKTAIEEAKKN